jgi:threonyl-tRNA synthetase
MDYVYGKFGFEYTFELSTRPENKMGTEEQWDYAEEALANALKSNNKKYIINPGDGAFYGPKIDVKIKDMLGRNWQLATFQIDYNLPERFDLLYQASSENKNVYKRPVIIHRAILGSLERFIGILTEHNAGKWPFWLNPNQVSVLPVSQKFEDYANIIDIKLRRHGYQSKVDASNLTLNKRIRNSQISQTSYALIIGAEEVESQTVNVRTRDGNQLGSFSIEQLLVKFKEEEII